MRECVCVRVCFIRHKTHTHAHTYIHTHTHAHTHTHTNASILSRGRRCCCYGANRLGGDGIMVEDGDGSD